MAKGDNPLSAELYAHKNTVRQRKHRSPCLGWRGSCRVLLRGNFVCPVANFFSFLHRSDLFFCGWVPRMQKLRFPSSEKLELSKVLSVKPGLGRNLRLHAWFTDANFFFVISVCPLSSSNMNLTREVTVNQTFTCDLSWIVS